MVARPRGRNMAAPALHVSPLVGEPRTQAITLPVSPVSSEPRSPCPVRGCLSQAPESQDPTFWGGRGAGAVPGARVRPGTVGPGKAGLWGVRVRGTAARGGGTSFPQSPASRSPPPPAAVRRSKAAAGCPPVPERGPTAVLSRPRSCHGDPPRLPPRGPPPSSSGPRRPSS